MKTHLPINHCVTWNLVIRRKSLNARYQLCANSTRHRKPAGQSEGRKQSITGQKIRRYSFVRSITVVIIKYPTSVALWNVRYLPLYGRRHDRIWLLDFLQSENIFSHTRNCALRLPFPLSVETVNSSSFPLKSPFCNGLFVCDIFI